MQGRSAVGFLIALCSALVVARLAAAGAAARPAGEPGRVVETGRMSLPRACHSATLLPGGKVLIAGGCTVDGCDANGDGATAELYDPGDGTFVRSSGRMTTERTGHSATLLPGGKVLLVGGWSRGGTLASAELYDPATGRFTGTGGMAARRGSPTAALLPDGRVLVAGGDDGSRRLASAEIYDPKTGAFARTGDMTTPRAEHVAAPLADGRVLVLGGSRTRGEILASAEIYDPAAGSFSPAGKMAVVRHKHAAIGLKDGNVLVLGGSDARDGYGRYATTEIFDPAAGAFLAGPSMSEKRYKIQAALALLPDGLVLVGGGAARAELFDPATRAFRVAAGSLDAARAFATATLLPGGDVLLAGGYDDRIRPTARAFLHRPGG